MEATGTTLTAATAAAMAAAMAITASAPGPTRPPDGEPVGARCDAEFQPTRVTVRQEEVTVRADLSAPVARVEEVAPEAASGLVVESFRERRPSGSSRPDVVIVLDTSDANVGEWTVLVTGDSATCEGTLAVRPPRAAGAG